jgi:hypothetical protein
MEDFLSIVAALTEMNVESEVGWSSVLHTSEDRGCSSVKLWYLSLRLRGAVSL